MVKSNKSLDRLKETELFYNNHKLTEYLKSLNEEELQELERCLLVDDIEGPKIGILDAVRTELEYRELNKYLSPKTSDFLSEEYKKLLKTVSQKEVADSINYLDNLEIDYDHLIKWCPIMLSVDSVARIYSYLRDQNTSDEDILKMLCMDSERIVHLNHLLRDNSEINIEDVKDQDEFKKLIKKTDNRLWQTKSGSESYKKVVQNSIRDNKEVLRKLQ